MELEQCTVNTPYLEFDGTVIQAKVVKVIDGDSINIVFRVPDTNHFRQFKCRLSGIDTPELRPRLNNPDRENIIARAQEAKQYLKDLLLNRIVKVKCGKWDKYGRLLITIYSADQNINELMIKGGYAVPY